MRMTVLRKWLGDTSGTTAIEFALMAIPFFTIALSIIEMSIMFTTASILEGATGTAARLIRTGQIQQATTDPTAQAESFRDAICSHAAALVNCNNVQVEVVAIESFGSYENYLPQYDEDGNLDSRGFSAGGASNIVLIRTGYRYTLMTPFVNVLLGENGTGMRYFTSTIVLQTEPYENGDA